MIWDEALIVSVGVLELTGSDFLLPDSGRCRCTFVCVFSNALTIATDPRLLDSASPILADDSWIQDARSSDTSELKTEARTSM